MKKLLVSICAVALVAAFALVGCSGDNASSDSKTIKVGAVPTPHAEILTNVVAPQLEKQGYTLEVVEFDDYVLPNKALQDGEIDANYFQHVPYLTDYNAQNNTDLVDIVAVHFEPMPLFAGKTDSVEAVKEKIANGEQVVISVPNDTTNEARALQLLAAQGIIELPENSGLDVTAIDIVNKPDNLTVNELDAAQVARTLSDVDLAVVNGNYAVEAGLSVDDALAVESADSEAAKTYANVLVTTKEKLEDPGVKALADALVTDEVKEFIQSKYGNAVVAVF